MNLYTAICWFYLIPTLFFCIFHKNLKIKREYQIVICIYYKGRFFIFHFIKMISFFFKYNNCLHYFILFICNLEVIKFKNLKAMFSNYHKSKCMSIILCIKTKFLINVYYDKIIDDVAFLPKNMVLVCFFSFNHHK